MQNPYDPETERKYNWHFDIANQIWRSTPKDNRRASFKPMVETRANHKGVQIRKVGTEKWHPVSEILTPPQNDNRH